MSHYLFVTVNIYNTHFSSVSLNVFFLKQTVSITIHKDAGFRHVHIIVWYHIVLYRNSNTNRTHFEQKQLRTGVSKYYIGPVGQLTVSRPCRLALHQPCQPRGRVLTLTDPRGRHFFENWHYPILLILSNARGGVLTLTDARGEVVSLFHQRGEVLTLADVVFTRTVDEVLARMKANRLQLNPAKTEVL